MNGCDSLSFFGAVNPHLERHTASRAGWLRAAVLGANDGLVSTASLMVGIAASGGSTSAMPPTTTPSHSSAEHHRSGAGRPGDAH